jgi:hypothetical protein
VSRMIRVQFQEVPCNETARLLEYFREARYVESLIKIWKILASGPSYTYMEGIFSKNITDLEFRKYHKL